MLTVEYANTPVWANYDETEINLQVKFVEFEYVVPFTATSTDSTTYGPELFANAVDGEYGPIAPYVPPPLIVGPSTLPSTVVNAGYIATLYGAGGVAPYSYALTDGVLPSGLRLQGNTIVGDLASDSAGDYSFVITVTDSTERTGSSTIGLTVYGATEGVSE